MKNHVKNIAASIRQKLLNLAHENGTGFHYILLLYFQERLLYRLSRSRFKNSFVLKGGLLLFVQNGLKGRTTKDIDFLGMAIPNDMDKIKEVVEELINMEISDGIHYDLNSIKLEQIKEDADYEGIRVTLDACLEKAKRNIQLDIGFGDVVTAGPVEIDKQSFI
jgi:predicted nucleotidyltransferase component of viral defense system